MDPRLRAAPVVGDLAEAVAAVPELVLGLYVGGSLASGDYRPGVSDIDAVALVQRRPSVADRRRLVEIHQALARAGPDGSSLHCVYVPRDDAHDAGRKHWTWASDELAGYWSRVLRQRDVWLQDVYVDIGLTSWARAEATISEGVLVTKSAAIDRMPDRGVPADVVDGIRRRRNGVRVDQSEDERRRRANVVRTFLRAEVERLLSP